MEKYKKVSKTKLLKTFYPYVKNTPLGFKLFTLRKSFNEKPHYFNDQIRINSEFPPFPSESFERITDIILNQKRIPHTIDFAITSNCPYNCPHCSYGHRVSNDLPTKRILKLIEEIKELGTAILGFTGGEPMNRKDLEKIVSASSPELHTIVYSTGYKFNKERAEKLYSAHIGMMVIGIDSVNPKIQNKIRGKTGSLDLAIDALNICDEIGIYTGINTVATREKMNNGEIERIYDLAQELNVAEIRLNFPVITGNWINCSKELLKQNELSLLRDIQKRFQKKKSFPIVTTLAEYESEGFMGCNTGYQTLFIDASGEICPCDFTPLSFGNINDNSLLEIWDLMGKYFPKARSECLMREICSKINSTDLPLTKEESKKLISKIDDTTSLPMITKKLSK